VTSKFLKVSCGCISALIKRICIIVRSYRNTSLMPKGKKIYNCCFGTPVVSPEVSSPDL
jgi:hypothetical protein